MISRGFVVAAVFSVCGLCKADVTLPAIFDNNMVLQRDARIPIWGEASAEERITVKLLDQTQAVTADKNGHWQISLDPTPATASTEVRISGKNSIVLKNVAIGDVWLASGQSNMEFILEKSKGGKESIESANDTQLRGFVVERLASRDPVKILKSKWQLGNSKDIKKWSAVGYFFGAEIRKEVGVPIGLIQSYWGGTPVEAWTPLDKMVNDPQYKDRLSFKWDKKIEEYQSKKTEFDQKMAEYSKEVEKAKSEGKPKPAIPKMRGLDPMSQHPGYLYNGMISPIVPFAIRGVIWYQGEQNASRAFQYRGFFRNLIKTWREVWRQDDFPFYFVQLPNFQPVKPEPSESEWAELREAQAMALSVTNTEMAVAIDVGEAKTIHPIDKRDVAHRLSLLALSNTYGRQILSHSPMFDHFQIESDKVQIYFKYAEGLHAEPTNNQGEKIENGVVNGFQVAGSDQKWFWAKAQILDDHVTVWSEEVKMPVAVRYAWADNPVVNLFNSAGLPMAPFRTDDWSEITKSNQ